MGLTAKRSCGLFASAVLVTLGGPASAGAAGHSQQSSAVIVVTTTVDTTGQPGVCSLRDAVTAANTDRAVAGCHAGNGADTIELASGVEYDFSIAKHLEISSPVSMIIDWNNIYGTDIVGLGNDVVFVVTKTGSLSLNGIFPIGDQAGVIVNRGSLSLFNAGVGAGVASSGAGGITNWGRLQLAQSNFFAGQGARAGALYNGKGGNVTAVNTTFYGNTWFSPRDTQGLPGAGAILNDGGQFVGRNLTITNNVANSKVGAPASSAGIYNVSGVVQLANSAVGNNKTLSPTGVWGLDDCRGTITSLGYNLVQRAPRCKLIGTLTGNILGKSPKLGLALNNGGATLTAAPLKGSPLIDAGNPAPPGTTRARCPIHDQRGYLRPFDGNHNGVARCDIGAVELGA